MAHLASGSGCDGTKYVRMDGLGEGLKSVQEIGRRGVEQFVGDAVDAAAADGAELLPAALRDDLFEGHAISGAAPGGEKYLGIGLSDDLGLGMRAGLSQEDATRGLDQLLNPELRMNEGLAPLFAIDERFVAERGGARPHS